MIEIDGVTVPDTRIASEATKLVQGTASPLLFNHSNRVYYFAALTGRRRGLAFDPELLSVSAVLAEKDPSFHRIDMCARIRHSRWQR